MLNPDVGFSSNTLHFLNWICACRLSLLPCSKRRLSLATEANDKLARKVADQIEDPLAQYDELRKFHIYAGDGHWHGASPHEARKDGKKWSAGHFYLLN
jgi:hypothetical protein